jgi:hypothetical protein
MKDNVEILTKFAQEIQAIKTVLADIGRNKMTKTDSEISNLKSQLEGFTGALQSLENQIMPVSVQNEAVMQMVKSKSSELDARLQELLSGTMARDVREYGPRIDALVSERVTDALKELKSVVDEAKKSTRDEISRSTLNLTRDLNTVKSKKTTYNGDEIAKSLEGKLSLTAIKDMNKVVQGLSDQVASTVASQVSQPLTVDIYDGTSLVKSGATKINAIGATYSNGVVTIPAGGGSGVATVTAGTNITITGTASNPIINATAATFTGVQQQFDNQTGTTVTLSATPNFVFGVYKNGIKQRIGGAKDYTIATNVITFTTALLNDDIEVVYN